MMQSGILFETEHKQDSYWQQQAKSILWLGRGVELRVKWQFLLKGHSHSPGLVSLLLQHMPDVNIPSFKHSGTCRGLILSDSFFSKLGVPIVVWSSPGQQHTLLRQHAQEMLTLTAFPGLWNLKLK